MKAVILTVLTVLTFTTSATAQDQTRPAPQSATAHARDIAQLCLSNWESASCLSAVSQSNYDLTLSYAAALSAARMGQATEGLKEYCAAATVIADETVPAYAFTSAYTECANGIYDISEASGVAPDSSHYQLLVGAVLCLSKDSRCAGIEQQLKGN